MCRSPRAGNAKRGRARWRRTTELARTPPATRVEEHANPQSEDGPSRIQQNTSRRPATRSRRETQPDKPAPEPRCPRIETRNSPGHLKRTGKQQHAANGVQQTTCAQAATTAPTPGLQEDTTSTRAPGSETPEATDARTHNDPRNEDPRPQRRARIPRRREKGVERRTKPVSIWYSHIQRGTSPSTRTASRDPKETQPDARTALRKTSPEEETAPKRLEYPPPGNTAESKSARRHGRAQERRTNGTRRQIKTPPAAAINKHA